MFVCGQYFLEVILMTCHTFLSIVEIVQCVCVRSIFPGGYSYDLSYLPVHCGDCEVCLCC